MVFFYAAAVFVSAALVFWSELLVGKMLLPRLGGAPQVFVTSLMVFQVLLLAGYVVAVRIAKGSQRGSRGTMQIALLVASMLLLPPGRMLASTNISAMPPVTAVVVGVLLAVGLPFFALTVHAPLLQRWFSQTRHRRAHDPYFLYAASNIGSVVGLLAFPFVLEANFDIDDQGVLFSFVFVGAAILVSALLRFSPLASKRPPLPQHAPRVDVDGGVGGGLDDAFNGGRGELKVARTIFLGFVPALHLGAVTLALSLDVAAIPLLWVLPLVAYLLSFVVAFSRGGDAALNISVRALPILLVALTFVLLVHATEPAPLLIGVHLLTFFVGAVVCHGHVAKTRPDPSKLTSFYVVLSLGGAIGGAVSAVFAPLFFSRLTEIPLSIFLLPFAIPRRRNESSLTVRDGAFVAFITLLTGVAVFLSTGIGMMSSLGRLFIAVPVTATFFAKDRPLRFAFAVLSTMIVGSFIPGSDGTEIHVERSFFGVHRIVENDEWRILYQGTTEHGAERRDPTKRRVPGAYYHPAGPGGEAVSRLLHDEGKRDVVLIGLGSGALASYAERGHTFSFLEIDPAVARIAEASFSYLNDARARGATVDVTVGDGRALLTGMHDVIVVDAFTSGAIPVHLITREAIAHNFASVHDDGVLLFHISNRHLDLESVMARLADDANLAALTRIDLAEDDPSSRAPSQWVIMAQTRDALPTLSNGWRALRPTTDAPLFTDQRTDLVKIFRFSQSE